jgi:hypothetical protein
MPVSANTQIARFFNYKLMIFPEDINTRIVKLARALLVSFQAQSLSMFFGAIEHVPCIISPGEIVNDFKF